MNNSPSDKSPNIQKYLNLYRQLKSVSQDNKATGKVAEEMNDAWDRLSKEEQDWIWEYLNKSPLS